MLILGRKEGEKIIIEVHGEKIEILVSRIKNHEVRIGIDAGKDVVIYREEIGNLKNTDWID